MKNILRHLGLLAAGAFIAGIIALILLDAVIMPYLVDTSSVQIPNLQGLSASEASARLEEARLKVTIGDSLHHETVPADAVVAQDPSGGQLVKEGRRIVLTVSKGPRYYEVPDVRRVSLREARLQLEENQLKIGQILYRSSDTLPEGAVVGQTPPPGAQLARDSAVDLQVSNGPSAALKRVPALIGLSIRAVEDTLRKYELRIGHIAKRIDKQKRVGTVLAQDPTSEQRIPRHSRIDLVVSAAAPPPKPDAFDNWEEP
ncbi:MAG: PASTA domain-containing protein [Gemmatimonadota bacterium]|nr:PASTA domain-containing protein [Gemmatimonadota bacterium]